MKKNVHTAGKSRKQKKIMLLLLELLIILLLAIALFITTKLSKIEKNKLDRKQRRYHVGKHRYETAYHQSGICLP